MKFFLLILTLVALQSTLNGEDTLLEREQKFNKALHLYSTAASQTSAPSSQLYRAIATSYFQLGEYPWSILYNYKALKLDPRNPEIMEQIQLSRNHLGLDPYVEPFSLLIPIHIQFGVIFIFVLITFIFLSLLIWYRKRALITSSVRISARRGTSDAMAGDEVIASAIAEKSDIADEAVAAGRKLTDEVIKAQKRIVKKLSLVLSAITLLLLFNLMLCFYFSPIEGVLVRSTGYYREPDPQQAQLSPHPLKAGTKMRILASSKQGEWLKTADANGLVGYVPASTIRII